MRVEMNGWAIVTVAMMLIGLLAIGLIMYYIRKGREERAKASAEANASDEKRAAADAEE
ncbi:MAG: hypothetical protein L3J26_03155 [Candidatus Polarisedimenticolaceae bacterium]|nr:hypothetical protein [Candidatus Polarisedimenticolaceae bacterium]